MIDLKPILSKVEICDRNTLKEIVNDFYSTKMQVVVDSVDVEIGSVLGSLWTDFKAQNEKKLAVHMLLVIWNAVNDPCYLLITKE